MAEGKLTASPAAKPRMTPAEAIPIIGRTSGCQAGVPGARGDDPVRTRVQPFLMFQGRAEAAMQFYVSLFPDGEVRSLTRYGPGAAGVEGSVMKAVFSIAGQTIVCIDSPVPHEFAFTPAISLFVDCACVEEIDRLSAALAADGSVLMPLGEYGFNRRFAWITDRFGISWQLDLE